MKKLLVIAITFFCVLSIFFIFKSNNTQPNIKVAVIEDTFQDEIFTEIKKLAKKDNFIIEIIKFKDYIKINNALKEGLVSVNAFQNSIYLEEVNRNRGTDFQIISKTILTPIGIYSFKNTTFASSNTSNKVSIAMPDDPINIHRSLLLLEKSNIIKLKQNNKIYYDFDDIEEYIQNVNITTLDTSKIREAYQKFDFTILPLDYARAINLQISDAIFIEDNNSPFVQLIVSNKKDIGNKSIIKLLNYYKSDEIKTFILNKYEKQILPTW